MKEFRICGNMRWFRGRIHGTEETKPALMKSVKTSQASDALRKSLVEEGKCLRKFVHPNIHALLATPAPDSLSLVLEDCGHGFLDDYLRMNSLAAGQARKFALDVCNAMIYLERAGFVHGDIAARNILLSSALTCKITNMLCMVGAVEDFARGTYTNVAGETLFRWPAPCLATIKRRERRTHQEDVWSYGFFLYELYTQGQIPYDPAAWVTNDMYVDTMLELRTGSLLPQPIGCSDELYDAMVDCWELSPEDRPSFQRIKTLLTSYDAIDELDSILSAATAAALAGGLATPSPPRSPVKASSGQTFDMEATPPAADSADLMEENSRLRAELEQMRRMLAGTSAPPKSRNGSLRITDPHPVGSLRRIKAPVHDKAVLDHIFSLFPDANDGKN